jgi:hypothetical protein
MSTMGSCASSPNKVLIKEVLAMKHDDLKNLSTEKKTRIKQVSVLDLQLTLKNQTTMGTWYGPLSIILMDEYMIFINDATKKISTNLSLKDRMVQILKINLPMKPVEGMDGDLAVIALCGLLQMLKASKKPVMNTVRQIIARFIMSTQFKAFLGSNANKIKHIGSLPSDFLKEVVISNGSKKPDIDIALIQSQVLLENLTGPM